jgi:hypothetical protein
MYVIVYRIDNENWKNKNRDDIHTHDATHHAEAARQISNHYHGPFSGLSWRKCMGRADGKTYMPDAYELYVYPDLERDPVFKAVLDLIVTCVHVSYVMLKCQRLWFKDASFFF